MARDCGCGSNPLAQGIEAAGQALSRRGVLVGAGAAAGLLALGSNVFAAPEGGAGGGGDAPADTIYHGGPIVTMVKDADRVEALAVRGGTIVFAGAKIDAMKLKGDATRLADLAGKCLMPGFIDPHSHVALQSAKFGTANLDPKPIGQIGSIGDIQKTLRQWIEEKEIEPGQWVFGWGYDDTGIEEMRHPTRQDLDAVSTEHPIALMHISAHLMAVNSRTLAEVGVTADTPDPAGGRFQREADGKTPNGVLEELAMAAILGKVPTPTAEQAIATLELGLASYAAAGITTAQDGASSAGIVKLLDAMAKAGKLPIDVVAYPLYKSVTDDVLREIATDRGRSGRLRRGGVKITIDGSIQGYTAFLSAPYHVQPGGTAEVLEDPCSGKAAEHVFVSGEAQLGEPSAAPKPAGDYRGYANMKLEEIVEWVRTCDARGVQLLAHTNGDAATDLLLDAVRKVRGEEPRPDLRTTIIHAQTMREDQLDVAREHGMCPSFFPIHVVFWGDRHRDIFLGPERAARISPAKSALDRGMKFTLHHDAPVAGIGMLAVAAAAVNRTTSSGKPLGPEQRITPFEALRAVTHDAAWQYLPGGPKGNARGGEGRGPRHPRRRPACNRPDEDGGHPGSRDDQGR